jgi:hypothetical protein
MAPLMLRLYSKTDGGNPSLKAPCCQDLLVLSNVRSEFSDLIFEPVEHIAHLGVGVSHVVFLKRILHLPESVHAAIDGPSGSSCVLVASSEVWVVMLGSWPPLGSSRIFSSPIACEFASTSTGGVIIPGEGASVVIPQSIETKRESAACLGLSHHPPWPRSENSDSELVLAHETKKIRGRAVS